ncbi:MAG: hypothetical protein AAGD01_03925 [Acidobacteriota bacterium]
MQTPTPNPVQVYLDSLPARNERNAREALSVLAEVVEWDPNSRNGSVSALSAPWWTLSVDQALRIQEDLVEGEVLSITTGEPLAPTAVNRYLQALKGVLRQCWRQKLMPDDAYLEASAKLRTLPPGSVR